MEKKNDRKHEEGYEWNMKGLRHQENVHVHLRRVEKE